MSAFVLKIIAMVTMIIDHMSVVFLQDNLTLLRIGRSIGRLAFPIFCFLIVEGYHHTKNVWKYMLRLLIFAVISEVPFDMMADGKFAAWENFNVLWTLLFGLLAITLVDLLKQKFYPMQMGIYTILSCIVIFATGLGAEFLGTDYGMFGVVVILIMFFARGHVLVMAAGFAIVSIFYYQWNVTPYFAIFAFIPIYFYNGKKGPDDKKLFYLVYPVHMAILGFVNMFVL